MVASASAVLMLLVETVSTVLPPLSFSVQLAADVRIKNITIVKYLTQTFYFSVISVFLFSCQLVIVTPEGQSVRFVMKQQVSVSVSLEPQVASVPTVCQVFGASLIVDHANVMSTVSTAILRRESARDVETSPWVTTVNGTGSFMLEEKGQKGGIKIRMCKIKIF